MREFFLFFIVFINSYQINGEFSDSFDDSDFINKPGWMGNIDKFEVHSLNQLHRKYDSLNGESYLSNECKVSEDAIWEFECTDLIGSISVYNSEGMLLNVLVNNEFLGASGSKLWNGTDENNFILIQGMYITLIDVISDYGFVNKYKKVVVLSN